MPSRKAPTLRDLTRRFPSPPELRDTFDALSDDTDQSIALVAASIAENVLERVIKRRLKSKRAKLLDGLFDHRGPVSDFNGKIMIAEAFGVISSTMAKELQHIRSIRNAFAHSAYPLTFSTDEIATAMRGFAMLNAADSVGGGTAMPRDKAGYLMVVRIICTILDHDLRNKGEDPILDY